jgi:hypothetical protein
MLMLILRLRLVRLLVLVRVLVLILRLRLVRLLELGLLHVMMLLDSIGDRLVGGLSTSGVRFGKETLPEGAYVHPLEVIRPARFRCRRGCALLGSCRLLLKPLSEQLDLCVGTASVSHHCVHTEKETYPTWTGLREVGEVLWMTSIPVRELQTPNSTDVRGTRTWWIAARGVLWRVVLHLM